VSAPLAYFITFTCYGTWLPGDQRGSVDLEHNQYGSEYLPGDETKHDQARALQQGPGFRLSEEDRGLVLKAIEEVCSYRGWLLLAAHVRSNHVHVVVHGSATPEKIMNDFKAYATRALNRLHPDQKHSTRWTRHGSTRHLWTDDEVESRIQYAVESQGEPMAVYVTLNWREQLRTVVNAETPQSRAR
jgi:REP element-mobilizing transposase RayT